VAPAIEVKVVPELVETLHCTVGVGSPEALAVNEALAPDATVTLDGFFVTLGKTVCAPDRVGSLTERSGPTDRLV